MEYPQVADAAKIAEKLKKDLDKENAKLRRRIEINEVARPRNVADYLAVAARLNEVLDTLPHLDRTLTPSLHLSHDMKTRSKNKAAVSFEAMYYLKDGKRLSEAKYKAFIKALRAVHPNCDMHGWMGKTYIWVVFDAHAPAPSDEDDE